MTEQLIKKKSQEVALIPEMVKRAKIVSGESNGIFIPFIPLLKINNKKKITETIIEGKSKKVEISPEEGFLLTTKNKETKEYEEKFYSKELSGVILKARYQIRSKFKVEPAYFSNEFDSWNEIVKVYNRSNREVIMEGSYSELKEAFKIAEKDSRGRNKKSFELFLVLYLDLDNEIFRFKSKMSSYNNWFDYKNLFGENDTYVAYKTNFKLTWIEEGQIGFWYVTFEKGEMVDLETELNLQSQLQAALNLTSIIKEKKSYTLPESQGEIIDDESTINVDEESKEEQINIDMIPF